MAAGIKLTMEEAIFRVETRFGKNCLIFNSPEYVSRSTKSNFTCTVCNSNFEKTWGSMFTSKNACPNCASKKIADKIKLGLGEAIDRVKLKHGETEIDFTNSTYVKSTVKSEFKCNVCETVFYKSWNKLISGKNACPSCAIKNARSRYTLTLDQAIAKSIDKYGDVWDFSESEYITSHSKTTIICKTCNKRKHVTWTYHLHSSASVGQCACSRRIVKISSMSRSEIADALCRIHPGYNVSLPIDNISGRTIMHGKCKSGHDISISLYNMIIQEHGCAKCGHIESAKKRKSKLESVLDGLKVLHGDKLKFKIPNKYNNFHDIIEYQCLICGCNSKKDVKALMSGDGCICNNKKGRKRNADSMMRDALLIHGNTFEYTHICDGRCSNITYRCIVCGEYTTTTWGEHLRGVGCLSCNPLGVGSHDICSILKKEQEVFDNDIVCIDSVYNGMHSNGTFRCSKCNGEYVQSWRYHLDGNGCPRCKNDRGCLLYYILIEYDGLDYYKIGITKNSLKARYGQRDYITPLAVRDYAISYDAVVAESEVLNTEEFLDHNHLGGVDVMGAYRGNTEVFTKNVLSIPIPTIEVQNELWITRPSNN